ncbi:hypothetical protein Tco_0814535 [Tanacetum coccineum]
MAFGNKKNVDAAFEPILDAHLQVAPHANTSCNPSLVKWNWDEVILIPSDDDEANVNEPIALPVKDVDVEVAPHHNPNINPKVLNWNWDDVIVVPSDDDEGSWVEGTSSFLATISISISISIPIISNSSQIDMLSRINGMIIRLSMALGNKKSVDDATFEPSLDAHLQIAQY